MDQMQNSFQKLWQFPSSPYNQERVRRQLGNFHPDKLQNPKTRQELRQFAEQLSVMDVAEQDVANLSYEAFTALKTIFSVSLNELSHSNEAQRIKLQEVEKENKLLERQLQKLTRIENQNLQKEKQIEEAIQRLQDEYQSAQ